MDLLIQIFISVFPVLLFLLLMVKLDSFKLLAFKQILIAVLFGAISAGIALFLNIILQKVFNVSYNDYAISIGPLLEELLKTACVLYFVMRARVGFMIDGALIGFAVGASFAAVENILFIEMEPAVEYSILLVRGVGTAIMHAGVTAISAILAMYFVNKRDKAKINYGILGFLIATFLHVFFNNFYFSPINQAIFGIVAIPGLFVLIFRIYTKKLSKWMFNEFDSEIELLIKINRGEFAETDAGKYFLSIKDKFDEETVVDLYAYIITVTELSVTAKSSLMMNEADISLKDSDDAHGKLRELKYLRQSIGRAGVLALSPILPMSYRQLWKLEFLKSQ